MFLLPRGQELCFVLDGKVVQVAYLLLFEVLASSGLHIHQAIVVILVAFHVMYAEHHCTVKTHCTAGLFNLKSSQRWSCWREWHVV